MSKSLSAQLLDCTREAEALSVIRQSAEQEKRFSFLLSHAKSLRTLIETQSHTEDNPSDAEYRNAFRSYLRNGVMEHDKYARECERRTYTGMGVGTDSGGGFFVPQNFYAKITSMLAAIDPLFDRTVVTYFESDNGNKVAAPLMSDEGVSAVLVDENTDGGEQEITLGQLLLDRAGTWRSKKIVGTYEWLDDSAFPVDDVIAKLVAIRFQRGIGAANVATLVTQASAAVTPVDCETSGLVTCDDIANLLGNINSDYVAAPTFRVLMNQSTLITLLKQKGSDGRYQSGVLHFNDDAGCYTIFGKRIAVSPSVDSAAADTSKHPVIAGDLSYWLQRVVKNSLRVLKYQNAPGLVENGLFAFEGFIRANGGLLQLGSSSPVQVLQCIA